MRLVLLQATAVLAANCQSLSSLFRTLTRTRSLLLDRRPRDGATAPSPEISTPVLSQDLSAVIVFDNDIRCISNTENGGPSTGKTSIRHLTGYGDFLLDTELLIGISNCQL